MLLGPLAQPVPRSIFARLARRPSVIHWQLRLVVKLVKQLDDQRFLTVFEFTPGRFGIVSRNPDFEHLSDWPCDRLLRTRFKTKRNLTLSDRFDQKL